MQNKLKKYQLAALLLIIHPAIICILVILNVQIELHGVIDSFVFGSIYIPLIIPANLGISVVQETPVMFSSPNIVGWLLIFTIWFFVYLLFIVIFSKLKCILNEK